MPTIQDAELGDEIKFYVENGYRSCSITNQFKIGKLIAIPFSDDYTYIVGWKGEKDLECALDTFGWNTSSRKWFQNSENNQEWHVVEFSHNTIIAEINPSKINQSTNSLQVKNNLADWRAWAHNRPGDCPCGINKQDCDYHK